MGTVQRIKTSNIPKLWVTSSSILAFSFFELHIYILNIYASQNNSAGTVSPDIDIYYRLLQWSFLLADKKKQLETYKLNFLYTLKNF